MTSDTFESEVLRAEQPVLVVFQTPWSHPCQVLASTLCAVAAAYAGKVKVVQVDADDNPDLSLWYEIQSIPTLLCFVGGTPRARIVGTVSKEALLSRLALVCQAGSAAAAAAAAQSNQKN